MTTSERIARALIAAGPAGLTINQIALRANTTENVVAQTRREWRAMLRDLGFNVPRPTDGNNYRYVATMDDEARKHGDEVRWKDMGTRVEEWIADTVQISKHLANQTPVDTYEALLVRTVIRELRNVEATLQALEDYATP